MNTKVYITGDMLSQALASLEKDGFGTALDEAIVRAAAEAFLTLLGGYMVENGDNTYGTL